MTYEHGDKIIKLLEQIAGQQQTVPKVLNPDNIAFDAAKRIEDVFAEGHIGGRTQRLAKVQVIVLDAMRAMTP